MRSSRLSAGSPKNLSAPCVSSARRLRWIAPTLAARDIAILGFELVGVVAHVLQHRAQILQIEQEEAALVGDPEDHVEHAFLRVVEIEQAPSKSGPISDTVARTG